MRDSLDRWYELLHCEIVESNVLDRESGLMFICDEEGKLKSYNLPNLHWPLGNDILMGTVAFVRYEEDEDGAGWTGLTDQDIEHVKKYVAENIFINTCRRNIKMIYLDDRTEEIERG